MPHTERKSTKAHIGNAVVSIAAGAGTRLLLSQLISRDILQLGHPHHAR